VVFKRYVFLPLWLLGSLTLYGCNPEGSTSNRFGGWIPRVSGTQANLTHVIFTGERFVVAAGKSLLISEDGVSWQSLTLPDSANVYRVAYGHAGYVALSPGNIYTSPDGRTWRKTPVDTPLRDVVYGNGVYLIAGDFSTLMASRDGVTWENVSPQTTFDGWTRVFFLNGHFLAFKYNSPWVSEDGYRWTRGENPSTALVAGAAYGNGLYVAVVGGGGFEVITSTNGLTWSRNPVSFLNLHDVAYGPEGFIAVGGAAIGGLIVRSSDGRNWISLGYNDDTRLNSVAYGKDRYVAVGDYGLILTSR